MGKSCESDLRKGKKLKEDVEKMCIYLSKVMISVSLV